MKRRDLFKAGAAIAAAPVSSVAAAQTTSIASAAGWKPEVLDAHENETVIALAELIIPTTDTPGGKAALVNRHIDKRFAAAPVEEMDRFVSGLAWLDSYAIKQHKAPFVKCTEPQQVAILQTLDTSRDEVLRPGTEFFRLAKRMISGVYYATEIGFKELNKGGRVPTTFACAPPKA